MQAQLNVFFEISNTFAYQPNDVTCIFNQTTISSSLRYIFCCKLFFFSETPGSRPVISPAGFQFLLMDTASQVWYFMLQYLETVEVQTSLLLVETLLVSFLVPF